MILLLCCARWYAHTYERFSISFFCFCCVRSSFVRSKARDWLWRKCRKWPISVSSVQWWSRGIFPRQWHLPEHVKRRDERSQLGLGWDKTRPRQHSNSWDMKNCKARDETSQDIKYEIETRLQTRDRPYKCRDWAKTETWKTVFCETPFTASGT